MKKIIFGLFLGFLAMQACKKSASVTETAIDASTLPAKVTEYIANNYPDAAITSAVSLENSPAAHIVGLDNNQEIAFDRGGDPIGDGSEFHGDGDSDGPQGGGHHGGMHGGGPNGNGHHGGGHCDGDGHHGDEISVDSLPQAIADYLAANYAGYTPKHAETDTLCSVGAVFEVAIFKDTTDRLKLFFDPSGTFLMSGSRVDFAADVPQVVKDFLTASYAGYTPRDKAVKLTLANGSIQYLVFLKNGSTRKKVFVNEDGTLVCEQ